MNREDLLEREDKAWHELVDALAAMPVSRRDIEDVVPGWSTHDLVWHCAYWAAYTSDVLDTLHRGEPEPEETDDRDALDAEILATGREMTWDDAYLQLEQGRERARASLSAFDELPESAVEWFQDDTLNHYEEHAAEIRAFNAAP
jgi:hypothetical protein